MAAVGRGAGAHGGVAKGGVVGGGEVRRLAVDPEEMAVEVEEEGEWGGRGSLVDGGDVKPGCSVLVDRQDEGSRPEEGA